MWAKAANGLVQVNVRTRRRKQLLTRDEIAMGCGRSSGIAGVTATSNHQQQQGKNSPGPSKHHVMNTMRCSFDIRSDVQDTNKAARLLARRPC